jgi:hypothetical protein
VNVIRLSALASACVFSLAAAAIAQPVSTATQAPPLRHLTFSIGLEITYTSETKGIREISDAEGGGTVSTKRGTTATGTIVCNVIAADKSGDLLLDVSEDSATRQAPVSRIVLHLDGSFNYVPNQRPLTEEEVALVPLLARGYIGPDLHPLGDSWDVKIAADTYSSSATFHVGSVRPPNDESVSFDQQFRNTGASGFVGTAHGQMSYDPTKLVPRKLDITTTSRYQQLGSDMNVRYQMSYSLKEDSFGR